MNVRSAKAKGKKLEKWIRDKIFEYFPSLTEDDVRTTVGSETGADIKLSKKAREVLPWSFEAKNRETFKTIYSFYEQAEKQDKSLNPVVIIKMNRREPLAIIDANTFFNLLRLLNEREG